MPFQKITTFAAALAITVSGAAYAGSHLTQDQQRAMDARQAQMGLYGFNLAPLGAMAQNKMPYDAGVATTAATNLAALAGLDQTRYWVEGTDSRVEGSRAKPEIFIDMEGYLAKKTALETTSAALAAVAGDGVDALRAAFGPVGQSCGACHEAYRVPRN
ncbi:c-type cytochrome [Yoonia sp.]|uniref:c-type cytochrome n=1 Tax=Yoonia sp. TaxID=2212373 RepID=UPI0035C83729